MRSLPLVLLFVLLIGCGKATDNVTTTPDPTPITQPKDDKRFRSYQLAELKTVNLDVNGHPIKAYIMDSEPKIAEGMMWLKEEDVKDDDGMIFVFEDARPRSFWMKNCHLALDVIFMDPKGKVLSIQHGKPFDEETKLLSNGDAMYALELKEGRSAAVGLKPGATIKIPAFVKPEQL